MTASDLPTLAAILAAGDGAPTTVPRRLDAPAWDAVLSAAGPGDLMPALWRPARTLGLVEAVPEALVEALGDPRSSRHHPAAVLELAHRRNRIRNRDLLDQLDSVLGDFAALGIEVVAIKGAAHLIAGTWPDPADRAMSDLDVLIDPGAGRAARRHLESLGYVAGEHGGEARGGHHHLPGLRHPDRFGSIELHLEPLQRGWRVALDADELWSEAQVRSWRGHRVGVPTAVHAAVISLVHAYLADGDRYQLRVPLRTVHELWRFDRLAGPVDWAEVADRLDGIGWRSLVDDHLITVEVLFGDPVAAGRRRAAGATGRSVGATAARARLALAVALAERPGAAQLADPWLRARSILDEGRLRRHYGTAIEGRWQLRLHHLSRQLPRRSGRPDPPDPVPTRPDRPRRPRALLLAPELPSPTGNGLAMRAATTLEALAAVADVTVAVIGRPPLSGPAVIATAHRPPMGHPAEGGWRDQELLGSELERLIRFRPQPVDDAAAARSWLADAGSRARLAALEPLADSVRSAHPEAVAALAAELAGEADGRDAAFDLVHVLRLRLAPWAEAIAFRAGVVTVLDLDDDELVTHTRLAATADERGEGALADHLRAEADALRRLADWYAPRATVVTVASPADLAGVARHRPGRVEVVPNAVDVGRHPSSMPPPIATGLPPRGRRLNGRPRRPGDGDEARLLLVGNFTYAPNRWGAEILVDQVRPALAARLGRPVQVELVGTAPPSFERFATVEGVRVVGHLPTPRHLDVAYEGADLVVLPLPPAGGTRLKLLEAFAHLVPVVATPAAVEGLGVVDGVHALVAEDADDLVDACARALADPVASRTRALAAWDLASSFDRPRVVARLAGRLTAWSAASAAPSVAPPGAAQPT